MRSLLPAPHAKTFTNGLTDERSNSRGCAICSCSCGRGPQWAAIGTKRRIMTGTPPGDADGPGACCGEADALEVYGDHYIAIITKDDGLTSYTKEWSKLPSGTRSFVPKERIQRLPPNPTGHGIIFIAPNGEVICYCPPTGA